MYWSMIANLYRPLGALVLGTVLGCSTQNDPGSVEQWPDMGLRDLHSNQAFLLDWDERPGLVNIWATWCGPCREEMPSLDMLRDRTQGTADVVTISVDDDLNLVREFLIRYQLDLPVYFGEPRDLVEKALKIDAYPVTFIVNRSGKIIERVDGPRNWASPDMVRYFESLGSGALGPFPRKTVQ